MDVMKGHEVEVHWRCVTGSSGFVTGLKSDDDVTEVVADQLDALTFYAAGYRAPSPCHQKTERGDLTRLTLFRFLAMAYARPIPFNLILPFLSGRQEVWTPLAEQMAALFLPMTSLALSSALRMAGRAGSKARSAYIVLTALKRYLDSGERGCFLEAEAALVHQGEEASQTPALTAALEPLAQDPSLTPDEARERILDGAEEVLEGLGIPSYPPRTSRLGSLGVPTRRELTAAVLTGDLGDSVQRVYDGLRAGHLRAVQRVLGLLSASEPKRTEGLLRWWWGFLNRERFERALSYYNPFSEKLLEALRRSAEIPDEEKPLVFLSRFYEGWESAIGVGAGRIS